MQMRIMLVWEKDNYFFYGQRIGCKTTRVQTHIFITSEQGYGHNIFTRTKLFYGKHKVD